MAEAILGLPFMLIPIGAVIGGVLMTAILLYLMPAINRALDRNNKERRPPTAY